ncbi:MAG TPA: hypothetical protein VFO19_19220 [Vicinamibacterales bacterium]|nr:hypothetical protein [Vicinamibacterales bacterium]
MISMSHGLLPKLAYGAAVASVAAGTAVGAATLKPESIAGWTNYVAAAERRIARELDMPGRFLATDLAADAAARRQRLLAGQIVVEPLQAADGAGRAIDVPSAMVHHWRGAVFIPGAQLEALLQDLRTNGPDRNEDVLASRVLERGAHGMRVYLRVQRQKFATVVYDTEHLVRFAARGAGRATSQSTALRIAEVENPNSPDERVLPPGQDRGFLWRWNAYWRYEQLPGGVIAECESISLSRDVPSLVRVFVGGLIRSTADESMQRTLTAFRSRFAATSTGTPPAPSPAR